MSLFDRPNQNQSNSPWQLPGMGAMQMPQQTLLQQLQNFGMGGHEGLSLTGSPISALSQGSLAAGMENIKLPGVGVPDVGIGGAKNGNGFFGDASFADKADLALSGIQTLGGLWAAFNQNKLANKQFDFTKKTTETNLANQIKSYNTGIDNIARTRQQTEGRPAGYAETYKKEHGI